jgi:tetratricopeptide (TPR) repeat protein
VTATAAFVILLVAAAAVSITFAWRAAEQRRLAEGRAGETKQVAEFQADMLSGLDAEAVGRGIRRHLRETLRALLERQPIGDWPNRRQRTPSEVDEEVSKLESAISPIPAADVARRVLDEFLLGQASKTVEQTFANQPLVQAQIRDSLSAAYSALGLQVQAEEQCRTALAIRKKELPPDHADIAENLTVLAFIVQDNGRYVEAEALCREALAIRRGTNPEKHVDVASAMQNLAATLRRQGKLAGAENHYRQALAIRRELLGEENLDTAGSINSLALLLQNKGDYAGAEPLFRQSLAIRRRLLGDRHAVLAGSLNNLANLLAMRGNRTEAEALLREALEMRRSLLGSEHPDVAQSLHNLGLFLNDDAKYAEAEPLVREAVGIWRRTLPRGHPDLGRGVLGLAAVVKAQAKYADAEPLFREALAIIRESLPEEDPSIANALTGLAALLCDRGDYVQAEPLYREIIANYEKRLPVEQLQVARLGLADTLLRRAAKGVDPPGTNLERLTEAETLLLGANESFSNPAGAPPTPVLVRRCLESLVQLYDLRHAAEPDKGYDAKAADYRARLQQSNPGTSPTTR